MTTDPGSGRTDRHETPTERLDRNWGDLLQELRVVQTGVQLLTGFLLTLPFQQRFEQLSDAERDVYLGTVAAAILATAFLQAPVSLHRALFRRHRRAAQVRLAHRMAIVGMALLAIAIVGVTALIFSVVVGGWTGFVVGVIAVLVLGSLWLVVPLVLRDEREPGGDVR
jgi:hypothetical protein